MMSSVVSHEHEEAAAAAAAEGNEGLLVPNDLVVEILSKIPASSLFRLRQVCKYWFNLITSDSIFINMNLHHSKKHHLYILTEGINNRDVDFRSSDYLITFYSLKCCWSSSSSNINHAVVSSTVLPTLEQSYVVKWTLFVGHCNGLLCIRTSESNNFCVWNPCTKEFKELPHPVAIYHDEDQDQHVRHAYGFGYDYTINDYKLIATEGLTSYYINSDGSSDDDFSGDDDDDDDGQVITRVCTLGAGVGGGRTTEKKKKKKWKIVKRRRDSPYMFRIASWLLKDSCGFFFNGGLYWMGKPGDDIESVIISFDISKEEYKEISIPQGNDDLFWFTKFDEFKGSLCILKLDSHFEDYLSNFIEAWMMKDDFSWTKIFTINGSLTGVGQSLDHILIKTSICNDNGEIIIIEVGELDNMSMLWYNPECPSSNTNMSIKKFGFSPSLRMYTCIESLVSLNSGTYIGSRKQEDAKKKQSLVSLNSETYIGRKEAKKKQRRRRSNEETTKEENNNNYYSNKKRKVSY